MLLFAVYIYGSLLIFRTWTSELHSKIPRSDQCMCFSVNFCRFCFYAFFLWFGMGRKFYCSVRWVRRCLSIFDCKCPACFPVVRDSLCQAKFLYTETVLTAYNQFTHTVMLVMGINFTNKIGKSTTVVALQIGFLFLFHVNIDIPMFGVQSPN